MSDLAMISQPMNGLSDADILKNRKVATEKLTKMGYVVVNTFFNDENHSPEYLTNVRKISNIPLYLLGDSFRIMSKCSVVYFCKNWQNARGCRLEHIAAKDYGLLCLYEDN